MKKFKHLALLLLATVMVFGCSKYDDTELRNDVNDLQSRVTKLEKWCETANSQISALQGLVTALEGNDYVTGVTPIMEGTKEVGYTITFTKSKPVTILHGTDGKDGIPPIIGVAQDTDGNYYWTVKIGDTAAVWMTDASGNKIPTTGDKGEQGNPGENGHSPVLSVADFEGRLYWKIDGNWLLNDGNKVPATGDKGDAGTSGSTGSQGDAIFAKDGIDYTTDPENVIFTLVDGTTKITLPKSSAISIGFDSYDTFYCSETDNQVTIVLPLKLKETDYNAIIATISNENGTGMDIQTRSTSANTWGVEVIKPTFADGTLVAGSAKVKLILPEDKTNYKALLKVTLIDSKGKEYSVNRVVWFKADKNANVIDNTTGSLSGKITDAANVKQLSVIGSLSDDDYKYIRENLTTMEVLDLSRASITSLPVKAFAFYDKKNTSLKTVILPEGLTTIGNSAFTMCENLQEIYMPKSVRTIGRWMFEGCNSLEEVKIPEGITEIPASAFYGAGIKKISIPSSVSTIGAWAFDSCNRLISANIPNKVTVINEGVFYTCSNLETVLWHDNITSIGADAFAICEKLFPGKSVVLPSKVTSIGARAFTFTGMTSVKLPERLETVENSAFNQCPISTIDLPSTITSVHAVAFYWSAATTVICRSVTTPLMPLLDEHNNKFGMFHQINSSCILKCPASSDYSQWNSYFGGGVQNL